MVISHTAPSSSILFDSLSLCISHKEDVSERVKMTVVTSLAVGEGRGRSLTPEEEEEEGLEGLSLAQSRSVSVGLTGFLHMYIHHLSLNMYIYRHMCERRAFIFMQFQLQCIDSLVHCVVYIPLFRPQQIACTLLRPFNL